MHSRYRTGAAHGRLFTLALLASSALTGAAMAQDSQVTEVEEIYVTAQKRTERLIDVPISITVNTAEDLKNKNIGDLTQLAQKMPNVTGGGSFSAGFTIRGISTSSAGSGFPPDVGVNIDEVFLGRDRAFNSVLADIASVELLRGPQGTLYGKNTIAGVINVTTVRPGNDFEALGDVQIGSYNFLQARGTLSGAIVEDKLQVRVTGAYQKRDGIVYNTVLKKDVNDLNNYGGRIMVVVKPNENLTVELRGDVYKQDDNGGQPEIQASLNGSVAPFAPFNTVPAQNPRDYVINTNTPAYQKRDIHGFSGKIEYLYGDYTLTSITAYRKLTSDQNTDFDGGPLDGFDTGRAENFNRWSQEFRITSPAGERFSWIAGAYFDDERVETNYHIGVGSGFPSFILSAPALPANYREEAIAQGVIDSRSWSVFLSGKLDITDQLKLSGGIRYTNEEKELNFRQVHTKLDPFPVHLIGLFALAIPPQTDTYSDSAFSGDVNLSYSFTPDRVAYVRYARGFKAGGFQSDVISPPFIVANGFDFKPETLDAWEIGYKTTFNDRKVSANFAAFYYDFQNKQEQVNTGTSFVVSNAAGAVIKGIEGEFTWRPITGLNLFANFGMLDSEYTEFPSFTGAPSPFTGNPLAGAAKHSASWGFVYTRPVGIPGVNFYLASDWDFRDRVFNGPDKNKLQETESFLIHNARVGLESDDGRWGAYIWGRNLGDEIVLSSGTAVLNNFYVSRAINVPRTWGVELRGKF